VAAQRRERNRHQRRLHRGDAGVVEPQPLHLFPVLDHVEPHIPRRLLRRRDARDAALVAFNLAADRFILWSPNGPSFQTVSGFERVIKPAWLDSIKPDTVFVGSSGVRDGFDPRLIDPALGLHSFNYGVSALPLTKRDGFSRTRPRSHR